MLLMGEKHMERESLFYAIDKSNVDKFDHAGYNYVYGETL